MSTISCKNCGGNDLRWHCSPICRRGVQDGRLRMSEIDCVFALGCEDCSETLRTVSGDIVAQHLTDLAVAL